MKIGEIDNQIKERTFAEGTKSFGEPGNTIQTKIIQENKNGYDNNNLESIIKTKGDEENNGENILTNEVKTHTIGDGTMNEEPLPVIDLNKINPDLYDPNAKAPGDTFEEDNWVEKNEIDGGGNNSGDCGDGIVCGGNNVIDNKITNNSTNIINEGTNVVENGMDVDMDKTASDSPPKTSIPTDGSIKQ